LKGSFSLGEFLGEFLGESFSKPSAHIKINVYGKNTDIFVADFFSELNGGNVVHL
jgi:hypothetical protein